MKKLILIVSAALALFVNGAELTRDNVIAHRGHLDTADKARLRPENTLAAFEDAVANGYGFECDIVYSKDKRVFTMHDGCFKRCFGIDSEDSASMTWDYVSHLIPITGGKKRAIHPGARVASFEEVCALARDGRWIFVEVKTGPEIVPLVKEILEKQSQATPKNLAFITFFASTVSELKRQLPEYKTHLLLGTNWYRKDDGKWMVNQPYFTAEECIRRLKECKADGLDFQWNRKETSQGADFVKAIKNAGFEFHYWCINKKEDAQEALKRGAGVITSNRPAFIVGERNSEPAAQIEMPPNSPIAKSPRNAFLKTAGGPLVQAHRGSCQEFDDNAAGGFRWCLEKGIKGFEIDLKFTKDEHIIVMHDETIDRTTDGKGIPEEMTFEELRQYRLKMSSEPIPDLDEILAVLGGRDDIFVEFEMKVTPTSFYGNNGTLERFCKQVREKIEAKMSPGTYVFTAWNPYTLITFRRVNPKAPLGYIICHAMDKIELEIAKTLKCTSVLPMMDTPKKLVDEAHALGMSVCLWPVKDLQSYNKAKERGSDRVTTDFANLLTRAIEGRPKKVVAMDLDATLCQHRSPIPPKNLEALKKLEKKYKCIMVGAGNAPRIYRQMGNYPIDIVANYGMQVAEAADGNFRIVKAVTNTVDREFFRRETDKLRVKYGYTQYEGEPLEFHASGMVTFGLLGTSPSAEHKIAFDPDKRKRRAMYPEVCRIFKDFSVYIGGSTSFDFAGPMYNKYDATLAWAKEHGYELDDIVFIGDDFADGGGDSHVRIKGMDHIVIYDYRNFNRAVEVLLK